MKNVSFNAETLRRRDESVRLFRVLEIKSILNFFLSASLCLCISIVVANAQNDGSQQNKTGRAGTFAITNARIVTVSGATIENGTLLIQNGKIAGVGTNVTLPAGTEKIDGKGLSVFPGMIDAGTNLGLAEIPLGVNASVDESEVAPLTRMRKLSRA